MSSTPVSIVHFSDLLCIWAYVAQIRLDELRHNFAGRVNLDYRFVPVFGSVRSRIAERWAGRGGLEAYAGHVRRVAETFNHVEVHPAIWTRNVPAGSGAAHVFFKAAALLEADGTIDAAPVRTLDGRTLLEELAWQLRLAWFKDLQDIGRLDVQCGVAAQLDLPLDPIRVRLEDGSALAALAEDHDLAARHQVSGSPTLLLNDGRQKLYGNVGYRIIEANIQELLRNDSGMASWC